MSSHTLISFRTAALISLACLPLAVSAVANESMNANNQTQKISAQSQPGDIAKQQQKERSLFVQNVYNAVIEKNKEGIHTITLENVSPFVTQFSERPFRKASQMPIQDLVNLWSNKNSDSFAMNPPNADIAYQLGEGKDPQNYAVVLTNPVYDADKKTLTYQIKALEGGAALPDSAKISHVSLFIDDVCLSCWDPS